jgi:integrase
MTAKKLTDAAIRNLKPTSARREIPDAFAKGLYVIIQPSGARSFALRFRGIDNKPVKLTLGDFDRTGRPAVKNPEIGAPLLLSEARLIAAKINHERASGVDVVAERKAERRRLKAQSNDSGQDAFGALIRRYINEFARPRTRRWRTSAALLGLRYAMSGDGEPSVIKNSLADRWRDRAARDIGANDLYDVIEESVRSGVPGARRRREGRTEPTGRALHACLSGFFTWCARHRRIDANPCASVHRPLAPQPRERVLNDKEIVAIWNACDQLAPQYGRMVRFLILSGARLREATRMRWDELNDDLSIWTLPAARAKNHRVLILPLPILARRVIGSIPRIDGSAFVFTFGGAQPIEGFSRLKRKLDRLSGVGDHWTWHDIRRSVATSMGDMGIAPHIVERCLNHISGSRGGVAGVYNRSELRREKGEALEAWSRHLEALIEGRTETNVIEMRRA